MKLEFYKCNHCGNVIVFGHNSNVPVMCCGEKMNKLLPNVTEGAVEKHVPIVSYENDLVKINVGSVNHPMDNDHYIEFIAIETDNGYQIKYLKPNEPSFANFKLPTNRHVKAVYAYCNKHNLWKANIK